MTYSPPQQAEHIRHQQLTPESPRPQQVPSPANIPILSLDKQMDPVFDESAYHTQNATPAPQYPSAASHTLNVPTNPAPHFADHSHASGFQSVDAQSAGSYAPTGAPSPAYSGAPGTQTQDTSSIQNYSVSHQAAASSTHDAQVGSSQDHSAYPFAHNNAYPAQPAPVQSAQGAHYQTEANAGGNVDVQALLDSLTSSANDVPSGHYASQMPLQSAQPQGSASASLPQPASNLPPRPPAQEKPATHPNYNPSDDIRSYHPGSQMPSNTQQRGNGQSQAPNSGGQQSSVTSRQGAQSPAAPGPGQRHGGRSETPDDEDVRWGPEVNRLYEAFLEQERKFVTEGQWDQFPMGSRLFIGNLPTEKVTKRDIYHRFYRHGKLAQISIKQAYGFVQFLDAESCRRALDTEQGQAVRGRKMHLEISKPQRNTKKAEPQANNGPRRRSRSPDYTRGGAGLGRDGRYGGPHSSQSPRDRDRRFRDRDDYRPMRSPSPRGPPRGMRSRDRSRDRYDGRYRSRSRTPPRRYRSPSPRRDPDDDLGLPRRPPHEVPDVQVLALNEGLPRDFIRYVEDTFRTQNLRINVLIMSPRLPEAAVVRRQIIEGVLAIVRLDTGSLAKGKVNVQVFDRRGGAGNVQFNGKSCSIKYADLDIVTAAMLINNAKQTAQAVQPVMPAYGYNPPVTQYAQPTPGSFPPAPAAQPNNISNIISSLDPSTLSQLLGAMSQQTGMTQNSQPTPGISADLARLLAQVSTPAQTPGFITPAQPQTPQLGQPQYSALAAMLGGQAQPTAQPAQTPTQQAGAAPDMKEIMAQLAKYQR
ncbi:nuclear polyadenylated RNA-binding protein 3 [Ascochyta rabiei]|uniref:nuclear polyadenylated RNA-binding protein 3 n=1 Tax=Didymella rabiei TaxID=5454 RepID=UPI002202C6D3|nr:nuclear polyadenylated RNA-binding protein 3 [Ascochyta rabiei]UPX19212.1 nuclear polyadenylated RNA-binding protein 3 [Ascochyta rabiei]